MHDPHLVIEDLASPALSPFQRQVLDQLDKQQVDLAPDDLVEEAIRCTGLDDFGTGDFRPRLNAYAAAIDADTGNTNLNRLILRNRIIRLLSSRLLLADLLLRYPEIHEIEIEIIFNNKKKIEKIGVVVHIAMEIEETHSTSSSRTSDEDVG